MGNMMKLLMLVLCLYRFYTAAAAAEPLRVPLTLIEGAEAKGAVCLDGTPSAYHLDRGYGSGRNSWIIQLEGGAWCNSVKNCVDRKKLKGLGSSKRMKKEIKFAGILSNKAEENPDFFNWNRVKLRYCDGASFSGNGQIEDPKLYFRGQLIWTAAMEHFMAKEGMQNATQALLSGCSAGGLASIIHCDEFRDLFPQSTKVKCLSDAGMFLDVMDITGRHTRRDVFADVVSLQGVEKNLPASCISKLDPTSQCFFPQNLIDSVKTPMFILNTAYDYWQIARSLVPNETYPYADWNRCKKDHRTCNSSQIQVFQDFRDEMLKALGTFSESEKNGVFINSCFDHCQSEDKKRWFREDSPEIGNTSVAEAVGNWYFDRTKVKAIDSPYPCGGHKCKNRM